MQFVYLVEVVRPNDNPDLMISGDVHGLKVFKPDLTCLHNG